MMLLLIVFRRWGMHATDVPWRGFECSDSESNDRDYRITLYRNHSDGLVTVGSRHVRVGSSVFATEANAQKSSTGRQPVYTSM